MPSTSTGPRGPVSVITLDGADLQEGVRPVGYDPSNDAPRYYPVQHSIEERVLEDGVPMGGNPFVLPEMQPDNGMNPELAPHLGPPGPTPVEPTPNSMSPTDAPAELPATLNPTPETLLNLGPSQRFEIPLKTFPLNDSSHRGARTARDWNDGRDPFAPPMRGFDRIPASSPSPESNGPLVTVSVRDAPLHSVLTLIAQQQGLSLVASSDLKAPISVTLQPTTLENALDAIMAISGCTWVRHHDVIYVTRLKKDTGESFVAQGREVRVFTLNYASAVDVEKVITGLMSPVGKVFVRQVDSKDRRKTLDEVVVEDLPQYVERVAEYLAQADQAPKQVMVEARILQIKLQKDNRHGVNLDRLLDVAGSDLRLRTQSFATTAGPGFLFTVDGAKFDSVVDCLASTNDSKTLASPKLLMINGQESKIQIGRRLGYFITTTTMTSTLQNVQFLDVGVVLTVTPQITNEGQVLMKVRPKVSSGAINPTTTLPEEDTTEVETSIMVRDGQGVIIGGLIQEVESERQSKVSFLGDLWLIGRLFQRRTINRERNEVVVALLPRIVPPDFCPTPEENYDLQRIEDPLLTPELEKASRPYDPVLPDAVRNPTHLLPIRRPR